MVSSYGFKFEGALSAEFHAPCYFRLCSVLQLVGSFIDNKDLFHVDLIQESTQY